MLEGAKLLDLALDAGATVESVYVGPGGGDDEVVARAQRLGVPVRMLAEGVLERVADTVTPQPVLAVAGVVDVDLATLSAATFVVVCVDIRDPGNLGTVLRVAEGAGADGVICCQGSVDPYNPKTVRASAGALFAVPVVNGGGAREVLEQMARWEVRRLGTRSAGGRAYDSVPLAGRVALVLGNEAHGLDDELASALDDELSIPMAGRTESLNVATAAAVLCFEVARQRRAAG